MTRVLVTYWTWSLADGLRLPCFCDGSHSEYSQMLLAPWLARCCTIWINEDGMQNRTVQERTLNSPYLAVFKSVCLHMYTNMCDVCCAVANEVFSF